MPKTVVRHEREHLYAEAAEHEPGRAADVARSCSSAQRRARPGRSGRMRVSGLSSLDLTALRYLVQGYRDSAISAPRT